MTWEDTPGDEDPARRAAQIASLTGLRGFAALMVVLIHTSVLTEFSWLGVPEYGPVSLFVLSGFLLYRPWARWGMRTGSRPVVTDFARRRLLRIFPAYLVVLLVVSVVYADDRPDGAREWFQAASLTWIYTPQDGVRTSLFQTWSLATELSWYVALPVMGGVAALAARRVDPRVGIRVMAALLCLSVPISFGYRRWVEVEGLEAYLTYSFWLPAFLFCFAAGAMVTLLLEGERAGLVRLSALRRVCEDRWALLVLALAVALVGTSSAAGPDGFAAVAYGEHQLRVTCATAVAVLLLLLAVFAPPSAPVNRVLSASGANAVGRWSYGIYLWHLPVIVVLERDLAFTDGAGGLLWRLAMVLAVSVPLGAATYAWVERPTMAWARQRYPRASPERKRRVLDRSTATSSSTASHPSTATADTRRSRSPEA